MQNIGGQFKKVGCAIIIGLVISQCHLALAGWTGLINGKGIGWASVNVKSTTLQTGRVTTLTNTTYPSAAMAPTTGYLTNAPLPSGSATNTYARIKGLYGGAWSASTSVTNTGDGTDNAELESRVTINPSECAGLTFDSQTGFDTNTGSGMITVNASATAGTALWLRGFEYTNGMDTLPADDTNTVENESVEYLKSHGGIVRFETLILGPFEFGPPNCPLIIPFTLDSRNLDNLIFVTDGVAKSYPLWLSCPVDVRVVCPNPVVYDPVSYSGCGNITITYAPTNGYTFPVGVTPVVVTATDQYGNSTNCSFKVTVLDTTPPVVPALPVLTGECSVQVTNQTATDYPCGATPITVTGTTSDPRSYNTQGTFTVHWRFVDDSGNTNTANQTVIVKNTNAPAAPVLLTVTGQCSASVTAPTATGYCGGTVIGTTSDPTNYITQGTNIVHWTFSDGNGNITVSNQTVIVKDTSAPTPPVLGIVTGQCSASVTAPTATDNCRGTVIGTTSDPTNYTTQGTNVVHWTFSDGNGNSSTANQTVIVKDTNAPVKPTLADVFVSSCSGSAIVPVPTANDNCAGIVTGTTTNSLVYTNTVPGTNVVHWTFNDGNGNITTADQRVIVAGVTFQGFYSPLGTVANDCRSPVIINQGSVTPIKFDTLCGTAVITGGQPPVVKIQLWTGCVFVSEPVSVNAVYQNNWHYNWDTTGWAKGIYKVIVVMQDGTTQYVFVKLK